MYPRMIDIQICEICANLRPVFSSPVCRLNLDQLHARIRLREMIDPYGMFDRAADERRFM